MCRRDCAGCAEPRHEISIFTRNSGRLFEFFHTRTGPNKSGQPNLHKKPHRGISLQDTLHHDEIEERENAGTPAILQTMRAALAFWVKERVGVANIEARENALIRRALAHLAKNPRVEVLGDCEVTHCWNSSTYSYFCIEMQEPVPELSKTWAFRPRWILRKAVQTSG